MLLGAAVRFHFCRNISSATKEKSGISGTTKAKSSNILSHRLLPVLFFLISSCASLPDETVRHERFSFPDSQAFIELPTGIHGKRTYKTLGWVRAKAEWSTLDQDVYSEGLCRNYFNKAVRSLLKEAKKVGADAVIQVRSVVFGLDGKIGEFPTPECSDDGNRGEVLVRGIAIKYKPLENSQPSSP